MINPELETDKPIHYPDDVRRFDESMQQKRAIAADNLAVPDQMMVNRILKRSDVLEDGQPLHAAVLDALAASDDNALEKSFEAGVAITDHIVSKYSNTRGRYLAYLNSCQSIDRIKAGWSSLDSPGQRMNMVMHFVRLSLSDTIEPTEQNMAMAEEMLDFLKVPQAGGLDLRWFAPKIDTFQRLMKLRKAAQDQLASSMLETSPSPEASVVEGRQRCSELMTQTMKQRRYGLKPAYIAASMGGSWVYHDPTLLSQEKIASLTIVPMAAIIFHSAKTKFEKLPASQLETQEQGRSATTLISFGTEEDMQPDLQLYLGVDGELYLDEFGWRRLRDEIGDTQTNLGLTAELLANFHDLTVPVEHVVKHQLRNVSQIKKDADKDLQPLLDLVVPRLKSYEKRPKSEPTPVEEPKRTVREHGVVWHIRVLPEGWHPSSEAVANARRMSITLGPNETFVREHKRGLGNRVSGHRIMRRLIDKGLEK